MPNNALHSAASAPLRVARGDGDDVFMDVEPNVEGFARVVHG